MLRRSVQLLLIFTPFGVLLWLLTIELVPTGVFVVHHSVQHSSPYIDALAPQDRVEPPVKTDGQWWQALIGDPVYFFLHPHRHFDRVSFDIWFQNTTVPLVEFGVLVQTKPDVYDLQPLHNLLIDQLNWPSISKDGLTLYQQQPVYDSLEAFYQHPPARNTVAVYKTTYPAPFRIAGYQPSTQTHTTEISLRGSHQFKTYIKQEDLSVRFEYMDMNRDEGADPIVVTVFDETGKPVFDVREDDDGHVSGDAIESAMRDISLNVPRLAEGVYTIALNASNDIFVRKIHTSQSKWIVMQHVSLGDEVAYRETPSVESLWTASKRLRMQTRHASGTQNVTRGPDVYGVSEPFTMYTFETDGALASLSVPVGDLEFWFDGPMAFDSNQYFQPDPIALKAYTDVASQQIQYILTSYQPPKEVGGWLVQTIEFDTRPLVFDKQSWKFTFSIPEMQTVGDHLRVKEINPTLYRQPFSWSDLKTFFLKK